MAGIACVLTRLHDNREEEVNEDEKHKDEVDVKVSGRECDRYVSMLLKVSDFVRECTERHQKPQIEGLAVRARCLELSTV